MPREGAGWGSVPELGRILVAGAGVIYLVVLGADHERIAVQPGRGEHLVVPAEALCGERVLLQQRWLCAQVRRL